jgi:hypothetical protein
VYVGDGEPLIAESMLIDNDRNGLYVAANKGLSRIDRDGTPGPSFQDNVVLGNGDRPITMPGSHADEIDVTNVLFDAVDDNGVREIELLSGTMRSTGTWLDHGFNYAVAADQIIGVHDHGATFHERRR